MIEPNRIQVVVDARHNYGLVPLTNDERRAAWAQKYYGAGLHRKSQKEMREDSNDSVQPD